MVRTSSFVLISLSKGPVFLRLTCYELWCEKNMQKTVGVKGAFFWRKRRIVSLLRRDLILDLKYFGAKKSSRKTHSLHPAPTEKSE